MNLKESPRRLWALIGAGGTLLIVAAAYFLLISGENSTRADLDSQVESARQVAATSRTKLIGLEKDNAKLPRYKAQLATLDAALPKTPESAQLVADMQQIATKSGAKITAINVTPPTTDTSTDKKVAGATPLSITVAITGPSKNLETFLNLLQAQSSRAVLVGQVTETVPDTGGQDSKPTMNIGMKAFFGRA